MEEEMLEQTNEYVDGATEEIVDEIDNEVEETTENVEQPTEVETPKMISQDEVNSIVEKRLSRERKRLEREYQESLSKYQELAYLNQEGLKAKDLDETLDRSREFYGKQGIKYVPKNDDDEIVGKYKANELIAEAETVEELESQAKRFTSKGNLSAREEIILKNLNEEIQNRKRVSELKSIGVTEDEYNSNEFREFEKAFTKETPIKDVYELYRLKHNTVKTVDNPGSMKTLAGKEQKGFISEAEYDKMTDKEIEENMDLIRESMKKW